MNKVTYSLILFLLLFLVACGHSSTEPTEDQILQDTKSFTENIIIGEKVTNNEKFQLTSLSIEEMDIKLNREKKKLDAEITAFVGDINWRSEAKHTITVHYERNASSQWEAIGVNVNDSIIRVIPRVQ
ncbi:hypothetical protein [Paenibacillus endoradicis]|uniref:hypothetical protein n=1 Tax=Paenibacillus endoradicis TaxID=2972487 RepID=UPI002158B212|nr:hypothetical protein [Paenibacillus endoradicis]MCR8658488.1 hypothetical protein [Paenibacillus endoradicis]